MLQLKNICFTRDNKKILDNINLSIDTDKFIAITGPNGSGKSTLVKVIMGILTPDSGKILLDGKDITNKKINERADLGIGFAFQQPVKFKGITVYDLIKISSKKDIKKAEACNILSSVGCKRFFTVLGSVLRDLAPRFRQPDGGGADGRCLSVHLLARTESNGKMCPLCSGAARNCGGGSRHRCLQPDGHHKARAGA